MVKTTGILRKLSNWCKMNDKLMISGGGRLSDKTLLMEKFLNAYLKKNPNATIITFKNGEFIIEKPVKEIN